MLSPKLLYSFTALLILLSFTANSQVAIRLSQPSKDQSNVNTSRQYIAGRTCVGCKLTINNDTVHVYSTGTFAAKYDLNTGRNNFTITATSPDNQTTTRNVTFYYNPVPAPVATQAFRIDFMEITPSGNLQLMPGDTLNIRLKAQPGQTATWINNQPLKELPASQSGGVPGYYSGTYILQPGDSLLNGKILAKLRNAGGSITTLASTYRYSMLRNELPFTGRTIDNMTYLVASPFGDRLGPDKIGYLDKDVLLHIVGKQNDYYKIRLSANHYAYIPEPLVDTEIPQEELSVSVAEDAKTWSDEKFDYVSVGLSDRLPYLSTQRVEDRKIIVDIHGAYADKALSTALERTREIKSIAWGQPFPDVCRLVISLKHDPWGYLVYYDNNRLVVRVKRQPEKLALNNLVIGLDAGHGGSNPGATGLTGAVEKQWTLLLALQLKSLLEREGATVLMSRTTEKFVPNEDRLSFFRRADPDILLSIHFNSSVNPVDVSGTANYYKQPFCEPLNAAIHARLLETGLKDFGNNGNFNFILNNPTEFPDALIETLFLSNPGDEEKLLQPAFQQLIVEKIVQGLKDYLQKLKAQR
ncbi:N-acetylmuramoyl-L-alanine amidase [Chitinophaga silvatica]|nr:N-acetylmuramoyl-L-alanine amidase [Chitinophaga silvatica]